mmetsp:Transcript_34283/g.74103  ORF Transcript_34283/g.74103 Transcript_34283/m.74103 type:complete len:89 (-) Transcript_34283:29-295(-)
MDLRKAASIHHTTHVDEDDRMPALLGYTSFHPGIRLASEDASWNSHCRGTISQTGSALRTSSVDVENGIAHSHSRWRACMLAFALGAL